MRCSFPAANDIPTLLRPPTYFSAYLVVPDASAVLFYHNILSAGLQCGKKARRELERRLPGSPDRHKALSLQDEPQGQAQGVVPTAIHHSLVEIHREDKAGGKILRCAQDDKSYPNLTPLHRAC